LDEKYRLIVGSGEQGQGKKEGRAKGRGAMPKMAGAYARGRRVQDFVWKKDP